MQKALTVDFAALPPELERFVGPGSIYEAAALLEELPHLKLSDGTPVAKSVLYKGYELWWMHYDSLFYHFCLPYTRYKKLLEHMRGYERVRIIDAQYPNLFACYLEAFGVRAEFVRSRLHSPRLLPFGVLLQMLLTAVFLPALMLRRTAVMVYTGDKFERGTDHDFRLRYIYEELRARGIPFVEVIRGFEGWKTVLAHAWQRRRAVAYAETAAFLGRAAGAFFGPRPRLVLPEAQGEERFKLLLATRFLQDAAGDVWAVRLMRALLRLAGVRAAYITTALERNFPTVLACKISGIPIVGILHGVASRFYNVYDFMPGFSGEKKLSVDAYGLWSEWWREYYLTHSKAYAPEQLFVSGPMRPLRRGAPPPARATAGPLKVLFIAEQLGVPEETLPYLEALLNEPGFELYLKVRTFRDGFEEWLKQNRPDILARIPPGRVFRGTMQEAILQTDTVVGSHSTAVLEALLQERPCLFYDTKKWGDYFDLASYDSEFRFIAGTPEEFLGLVRASRTIPREEVVRLRERFFGDPYQNGSAWVVDELERRLRR